jgi:Raf kinase inhibitor-like YbhB/YbcL family protein
MKIKFKRSYTVYLWLVVVGSVFLYAFFANSNNQLKAHNKNQDGVFSMNIVSNAFSEGQDIPSHYTCDGEGISPHLSWSGAPTETKSYVLICDDPDAPKGTWVHWVVFNIPASVTSFQEGQDPKKIGAYVGINSWGAAEKPGFGGPCPPSGTHRYYFKIYALDIPLLSLDENTATKEQLLAAMNGHIRAQGQLMGRYTRK